MTLLRVSISRDSASEASQKQHIIQHTTQSGYIEAAQLAVLNTEPRESAARWLKPEQ